MAYLQEPSEISEAENSYGQSNKIIKLSYLVSKDGGEGVFKTIGDAIKVAKQDSVIKIAQGLYEENLTIVNKSLKFEAKDMSSEVYIVAENGPAVYIDSPGGEVVLERIKFGHRGYVQTKSNNLGPRSRAKSGSRSKSERRSKSNTRLDPSSSKMTDAQSVNTNMTGVTSAISSQKASSFKASLLNYFSEVYFKLPPITKKTKCIVLANQGKVEMRNCSVNLNLVMAKKIPYIPAIICKSESSMLMTDCELRGSNNFDTLGVLAKESNLIMKDCTISHFKTGGICMHLENSNSSKISNCKITFNGGFGIQVLGKTKKFNSAKIAGPTLNINEEEERDIIEGCEIEKNDGPGIQVCTPNNGLIQDNNIVFNKTGIEVISADPKIINNSISKNIINGISVKSIEGMFSVPLIKGNIIKSNRENGILCTGMFNLSKIIQNSEISFNKLCGIKVESLATPVIIKNVIMKNIFQGILIVENSSAHIEKNKIAENIKANIAFGGDSSANTVITHNTITDGRCEGIFMIEAGSAYIKHNLITRNYDGIIMITSSPELHHNNIHYNKNSGVMVMKDSRPKLYSNYLSNNRNVGFFIRDNSRFYRSLHGEDVFSYQRSLSPVKEGAGGVGFEREESLRFMYSRQGSQISQSSRNQALREKEEEERAKEKKGENEEKEALKEPNEEKFWFFDNEVDGTDVALVVERPISDGKKILELNNFNGLECRIPYKCKEVRCTLI